MNALVLAGACAATVPAAPSPRPCTEDLPGEDCPFVLPPLPRPVGDAGRRGAAGSFEDVFKSHLGEILDCYRQEVAASGSAREGKVEVELLVGNDGYVRAAKVNESEIANPDVERCMLKGIREWKFPEPRAGTTVTITYPFFFKMKE